MGNSYIDESFIYKIVPNYNPIGYWLVGDVGWYFYIL